MPTSDPLLEPEAEWLHLISQVRNGIHIPLSFSEVMNMTIAKKIFGLAVLFLMFASPPAGAQTAAQSSEKTAANIKTLSVTVSRPARVRLDGFTVSAGIRYYSGIYPFYYYPTSCFGPCCDSRYFPSIYGFHSPLWYHTGWFTGFAYQDGKGEVRFRLNLPEADVYLDDGFAGKAKDLKTMWLEPGAYNLKVESADHKPFAIRIYVLSGKTLKIDAKLIPQKEP
jgi:hypothetical protein